MLMCLLLMTSGATPDRPSRSRPQGKARLKGRFPSPNEAISPEPDGGSGDGGRDVVLVQILLGEKIGRRPAP